MKSARYPLRRHDLLFFVHIPKTAGTTLNAILNAQFDPREIAPLPARGLIDNLRRHPPELLAQYRLMRGHAGYDVYRYLPRKPVYMTMLRHPLARISSVYRYLLRTPEADDIPPEARSSLAAFVEHTQGMRRFHNRSVFQVAGRYSTSDAARETLSDEDYLLLAKTHLDEFAFVGLVERFDESMNLMTDTFGWPRLDQYATLNTAPQPTHADDIPPDVVAQIESANALDMALYAHAVALFEARLAQSQPATAEGL